MLQPRAQVEGQDYRLPTQSKRFGCHMLGGGRKSPIYGAKAYVKVLRTVGEHRALGGGAETFLSLPVTQWQCVFPW